VNLPAQRVYGGWLALARFLTGVIWLIHGVPKFLHGDRFLPPGGFFADYLQKGIAATSGPYRDFLASVVQPNAAIFAELVRLGEVAAGVSLALGLFSRLGGAIGVALPLNYIAARGAAASVSGWGSIDACIMLLSALSLVLPTGRVAGFDALFARRRQRRVKVVAEVVPERPLDAPSAPPQ